jgi:NAD(P)H-nitrite reductase large subunit
MDALLNEKQRNGRYALLLNQIFAPRDGLYNILDGDTVICRCEGVAAKEIMAGIELGARNINMVKRTTRSGMGLCQGRTCESIITQLMLQRNIPIEDVAYLNLRPPLSPMPLDTFITSPV